MAALQAFRENFHLGPSLWMEIGTLVEEPDRATAATYWDLTGLTGAELGRAKKTENGAETVGRITVRTSCHSLLGLSKDREDHG